MFGDVEEKKKERGELSSSNSSNNKLNMRIYTVMGPVRIRSRSE